MDDRARLKRILQDRSILKGDFTLVSGKKSSYYINGKMTSLYSHGLLLAARLLLDLFDGIDYDAFAGPTIGADPLIGALLTLSAERGLEKEGLLIRKEPKGHGTQKLVEGNMREGLKVIVLEDVVTTGGSLLRAAEAVKAEGGAIVGIYALVDREEGAGVNVSRAGLPFDAVFKVSELL
jgi:orotate phosphoribosyltransferase